MPFLNAILLWGMFAASLPVIIHLLNRRKARIIDWGAMRFLEVSLATRGRRVLLEEILLLIVRTLLIGVLVFALARPLLRDKLLTGSGGATQDVVIVLDGSMSMAMTPMGSTQSAGPGVTYFTLAQEAAVQAVDKLAPGDAVAVVLAGSSLSSLTDGLTFDRESAKKAIRAARVTDGVMDVPRRASDAAAILKGGNNYHKQIVIITDGRANGWSLGRLDDWQALANQLAALRPAPRLEVLTLAQSREAGHQGELINLAIGNVSLSRPVVGTDLPILLTVEVRNTGQAPAGNVQVSVRLDADDREVADRKPVGMLAPDGSADVQLELKTFDKAKGYRLLVELESSDYLAADNRLVYAVNVLRELPVLLVKPNDPLLPARAGHLAIAQVGAGTANGEPGGPAHQLPGHAEGHRRVKAGGRGPRQVPGGRSGRRAAIEERGHRRPEEVRAARRRLVDRPGREGERSAGWRGFPTCGREPDRVEVLQQRIVRGRPGAAADDARPGGRDKAANVRRGRTGCCETRGRHCQSA